MVLETLAESPYPSLTSLRKPQPGGSYSGVMSVLLEVLLKSKPIETHGVMDTSAMG